ncbi:MAG: hypothetical protein R6U98_06430 [Pirellulaceae bacterium]
MKESYEEDGAHRFSLQRRGDRGNKVVLSVRVEGQAGQLLSSEITTSACRFCPDRGKATWRASLWPDVRGRGGRGDSIVRGEALRAAMVEWNRAASQLSSRQSEHPGNYLESLQMGSNLSAAVFLHEINRIASARRGEGSAVQNVVARISGREDAAIGKVNSHSAEASGILDIVGKGPTIWLETAQK